MNQFASNRHERAIWEATAVLNESMMKRAMKNAGEVETAPTTMELMRDCIAAYESVMSTPYDSLPDTRAHIAQVQTFLLDVIHDLQVRARDHDQSKLMEPEKAVFDEYTPKLRDTTYGSDEYKRCLEGMDEGLKHHYAVNDHHPEHHPFGIESMTLVQLIEMLADWKAATLRHADGDLRRSIRQNAQRFGYGGELEGILLNTAHAMGWLSG